ncbi:hypothetical protein D3C76_1156000 [compost metagenome]
MHHGAASEVQHAPVPHQRAITAPDHVRDRRIHQGEPDAHEHQHRGELHALGEGTDDQRRGNDGEGHLEGDEHRLREQRGGRSEAVGGDTAEKRLGEATDEGIEVEHALFHTRGIEGHAVAVDDPENAHQTGDREALHHHREHVLGTHHTAIEQGQARDGHEQHQRRSGQHPGSVAGVQRWGSFLCQGKPGHYEGQ